MSTVPNARARPTKLRSGRLGLLAVGLALVCAVPLAAGDPPWTLLVLLVPVFVAIWILRTGVDVSSSGLVVRALFGKRSVPWDRLAAVRVGERTALWAVRTDGSQVRLTGLSARDLPRLYRLTDGRIGVEDPRP
ncbi:MAG TPA: PH domain-containing protein, partial [Mycobacteriales bacterium]|nr:PH domain-containing protein [Mycobacteriales bacterium]